MYVKSELLAGGSAEASTLGLKGFPSELRVEYPHVTLVYRRGLVSRDREGNVTKVQYDALNRSKASAAGVYQKVTVFND